MTHTPSLPVPILCFVHARLAGAFGRGWLHPWSVHRRKALELDGGMKLKPEIEMFLQAYDDTADVDPSEKKEEL